MKKNNQISLKRFFVAALASLLLLIGPMFTSFAAAASLPQPSLAVASVADRISDSIQGTLLKEGKKFLGSILGEYFDKSGAATEKNFKLVQKTVAGLTDLLKDAAKPNVKPAQRDALLTKVSNAQQTLQNLASAISNDAKDTEKFATSLESSFEDLLALVKGQVRDQLNGQRDALTNVSKSVASIAEEAKQVDGSNLGDLIKRIGTGASVLNKSVDIGSKALKALSAFTS